LKQVGNHFVEPRPKYILPTKKFNHSLVQLEDEQLMEIIKLYALHR